MFDAEECWFTHSDQGSTPRKAELADFICAEVKRVVTEEKVSKKKVANKTVKKLKKKCSIFIYLLFPFLFHLRFAYTAS